MRIELLALDKFYLNFFFIILVIKTRKFVGLVNRDPWAGKNVERWLMSVIS